MRHRHLFSGALFTFLAALLAASCGSDSPSSSDGECTPGATRECVGPAACKGGQTCSAKRAWSACDCGGATGGAGGSGGSPSGGGAPSGGGTQSGGGAPSGGGSGGVGGDASATGGVSGGGGGGVSGDGAVDVVDSGVGPNDDPCPNEMIHWNCSAQCGGPSPTCGAQCGSALDVSDPTIAAHFVARTPSAPGVPVWITCHCSADAGVQALYVMRIPYQGVPGGGYQITVGKPWKVWATNQNVGPVGCINAKFANGCASISLPSSGNFTFFIATDDPYAPARNVLIQQKNFPWACTASDYWQ